MSSGGNFLSEELSKKTSIFGLRLWVIIGIGVGASIVLILFVLSVWLSSRRKPNVRRLPEKLPSIMIPVVSKEIEVDHIQSSSSARKDPNDKNNNNEEEARPPPQRLRTILGMEKSGYKQGWDLGQKANLPSSNAVTMAEGGGGDNMIMNNTHNNNHNSKFSMDKRSTASADTRSGESAAPSPVLSSCAVPEVSHLGWGHWYTLRELEVATNYFSDSQVLGEGGYGIVYQGCLPDGTMIAVKNLLNNRGQAEKEFRVEVEAIGRVRHKNLVRLIGYCAEGSHRMLVYEYVDNGNLDQWIHGPLCEEKALDWETRMKIVLGTAKGLAYLHEGLEPKVVHRDVKSSNILLDAQWNPKVSDFGLAKLLGAGKSHVTTRVMGTFGYVAPEYANTGLLNERSDVYSFGVLLMELITGREPVDYARPPGEVNLVDWLKLMVGSRRSDEVADPRLEVKPTPRALKRALLVALRCVDPDSAKRPKMGQIVHMLEADDYPFRDEHRSVRGGTSRVKESPKLQPLPGDASSRAPPLPMHAINDSLARKQDTKVDGIEINTGTPAGHNLRVKKYEV